MKMLKKMAAALFCCVPWAYLAIWLDGKHGAMLGYLVMVAAAGIMCCTLVRKRRFALLAAGNLVGAAASAVCICVSELAEMNWYFKPLTVWGVFALATAVLIGLQAMGALAICRKNKR